MFLFNLISNAYAMAPAQTGEAQQSSAMGFLTSIAPLILIFAVFYFLLIRPQQKKTKEHKQMLDGLKEGDKVITAGGLYGVVKRVDKNTVIVKISKDVDVRTSKPYISAIRAVSDED